MKSGLLCLFLLSGLAANAQLLPVPNSKNPDWVLLKTEKRHSDNRLLFSPGTDKMPNAAEKSIISKGNHHYHWDASQQLVYDWVSAAGMMAPLDTVNVREQRSDIAYIYRRARKTK
ncbi:hypothetical protein [Hymenobacter ruber]